MQNTIMYLGTLMSVLAFLAILIVVAVTYADHRAHERFEAVEMDKGYSTTLVRVAFWRLIFPSN